MMYRKQTLKYEKWKVLSYTTRNRHKRVHARPVAADPDTGAEELPRKNTPHAVYPHATC